MYKLETKDTDYMAIVTTHECGRNCPFCIDKYRGRKEYISLDDVERALDFACDLKVKDIFLTGGEPTNHPLIVEIARMVKDRGFNLVMTTNYENPFVMKCLDGIVDSFNVSYYGQKELPSQKDFKSDITLSTIIWQDRFPTQKDLDDLPNSKYVYAFEFYPAQIYRNHVIMRADLPHIENDVSPWVMFPNGEIVNSWTRKEEKRMELKK